MNQQQHDTYDLMEMIRAMVDIIRYDNGYAYDLLRRITLNRNTVIRIDDSRVSLRSKGSFKNYHLFVEESDDSGNEQFVTTSLVLRKIMSGIITIDTAIVNNEIFIKGEFEDLVNMHRLTTTLLAEGPLNRRLRDLWTLFSETWHNDHFPIALLPLEQQKPQHGKLLDHIPEKVLLIKI